MNSIARARISVERTFSSDLARSEAIESSAGWLNQHRQIACMNSPSESVAPMSSMVIIDPVRVHMCPIRSTTSSCVAMGEY